MNARRGGWLPLLSVGFLLAACGQGRGVAETTLQQAPTPHPKGVCDPAKYADGRTPSFCDIAPARRAGRQVASGRLRFVREPLIVVPGVDAYLRVNRALHDVDVKIDGRGIVQAEPVGFIESSSRVRCVDVPKSLLHTPAHLKVLRPGQTVRVTLVDRHGGKTATVTTHTRIRHNYAGIQPETWFAALGCPGRQVYGAG